MGSEREFEGNMKQLVQLLKKIMAQFPGLGKEELAKLLKNSKDSPDVNIFFLNLAPLDPEELDDLEEMIEENLYAEGGKSGSLRYEISREDEDFLKRHGIRF